MGANTNNNRALSGDKPRLVLASVGWFTLWLTLSTLTGCSSFLSWDSNHASGVRVEEGRRSYYIVAEGDTLYSIAFQMGVDYRQLARWNGIRWPYRIYPNQKLRLDATTPVTQSKAKSSQSASSQRSKTRPAATSRKKKSASRAATKSKRKRIYWKWPTYGPILSRYSSSAPGRSGLDIGGKLGQPVRAAATGRVVYSGSGLRGYGKLIIVKHDDVYLSAYGHNRKLLVKEGETLRAGQVIAELGDSGTNRPKLHFEIRKYGEPIDPQRLLPKR